VLLFVGPPLASGPFALAVIVRCLHCAQVSSGGAATNMAQGALLLAQQMKELNKADNGSQMFSCGFEDPDNPFKWEITIFGPPGTPYESGLFKAQMTFPPEYPNLPPKLIFTSEIWHPNIYGDGKVCISILHTPGEDSYGYEHADERWRPIHTAESILLSVISMLGEPNCESPANIDAAKMFRDNYKEFEKKVRRCVRKSQDDF